MFDKKELESAELYKKRYKNFATLAILPISVFFIFILLFILFAKKQLIVTSVGDIEPTNIVAQIQSTSSDPIIQNNLVEGETVQKNELLIKYNGSSGNTQLDGLNSQLAQAEAQKVQLGLLQDSLNNDTNKFPNPDNFGYYQEYQTYQSQVINITDNFNGSRQAVNNQKSTTNIDIATIRQQLTIIRQQIADYISLENAVMGIKAISASNPYYGQYVDYQTQLSAELTQKATIQSQFLKTIQSSINQFQNQESSLNTQLSSLWKNNTFDSLACQILALKTQKLEKANQDMINLDTIIADLNAKFFIQMKTNSSDAIYSSGAGILHVLPNVLGLKTIGVGTALADIYPSLTRGRTISITTYIPSSDISMIKEGQSLRFSVQQNIPKPLILTSTISSIDVVPTTKDNINTYKVEASYQLSQSDLEKIRYGLQGKVVVIIGEKTYFDYYRDIILGNG